MENQNKLNLVGVESPKGKCETPVLLDNVVRNTYTPLSRPLFNAQGVKVFYGGFMALQEVNMEVPTRKIIAFIGLSGCGKSTFLRCFNRMNDLITGAKVEGKISYQGKNIYAEAFVDFLYTSDA